jgi:hypothetical protein
MSRIFFREELEYPGTGTMFRESFRKKIRGIRGIRLIRDKAKKIRMLSKASILDEYKKYCSTSRCLLQFWPDTS